MPKDTETPDYGESGTRSQQSSPVHEPGAAKLASELYRELRAVAQNRLASEQAGHTLSATALVHEAFLRLGGARSKVWKDRSHFYLAAAEAMRRILIDHARSKRRQKRGGKRVRVSLDSLDLAAENAPEEILSLDDAIRRLEEQDKVMAKVVHLRFFAGLSIEETAAALGLSPATVKRRWGFAKAWLFRELSGGMDEEAT